MEFASMIRSVFSYSNNDTFTWGTTHVKTIQTMNKAKDITGRVFWEKKKEILVAESQ